MKEVAITINSDGSKVEFDAKNFEGASCKDFLGNIMNALGEVEKEERKPEFYGRPHQKVGA